MPRHVWTLGSAHCIHTHTHAHTHRCTYFWNLSKEREARERIIGYLDQKGQEEGDPCTENEENKYNNMNYFYEPSVSQSVSSVAQSSPTLCDPMNCSTLGLPVHHQLPEFTQTHHHRVGDAIQASHPLSSPFPPAPNSSQHQSLFQWVNSSHEVAKVLEFQL